MPERAVKLVLYRWAGQWGPFKVNIPCGECSLTADIIKDTLEHELAGIPVEVEIHDWLSQWWKPLARGGWHAPIVLVDNQLVCQGRALNRGVLTEAVIAAHARRSAVTGTHVYGKASCPHCARAKAWLEQAGVDYVYHDVVRDSRALYEMLGRVKPIIGPKTPVTVPQIWIDGGYVGGAGELAQLPAFQKLNPTGTTGAAQNEPSSTRPAMAGADGLLDKLPSS